MKVTVITPTFNPGSCLSACIESVASQTHGEIEHIVIDGFSLDGTSTRLQEAARRYSHLRIVSERDQGVYDALNKGLALATGDYVLFLGADDVLADNTVIERIFAKASSPNADVIYGNVVVNGDGLFGVKSGSVYDGEFDLNKLIRKNICHQAIFYSKEIIKKAGGYNLAYRYLADWDYNLRCFSLGHFEYVDVTVAQYNSYGVSSEGKDLAFELMFFEELRRYYGLSFFDRRFKAMYPCLGYIGKKRLKQKEIFRGLHHLIAACWHSPAYVFSLTSSLAKTGERAIAAHSATLSATQRPNKFMGFS